jgi:hypothetical protein
MYFFCSVIDCFRDAVFKAPIVVINVSQRLTRIPNIILYGLWTVAARQLLSAVRVGGALSLQDLQ